MLAWCLSQGTGVFILASDTHTHRHTHTRRATPSTSLGALRTRQAW